MMVHACQAVQGAHTKCSPYCASQQSLELYGLRLQGNPMAYLVESAGGRAITHEGPVLDIVPTSIHERCPIFLGSRIDIEELEAFLHAKAR